MASLAQRLVERTGRELVGAALDALSSQLADAMAEVDARWPELRDRGALDEAFVETIALRVEGEELDTIARLALADLYLVAACLLRDVAALAAFERIVREEVTRAIARLASPIVIDEVVQELLLKLVASPDARRLAAYTGHGTLHAWLRVAAVRAAISLARKRRDVAIDDDVVIAIADDADDAGLAFIKASYRAEFKRAFGDALADLAPRARTLLRLQIIDQLTLEEIGAFYRVSRTTTARWLADARRDLVAATHTQLATRLRLSPDELAELSQLAASNLYATLPSLLRRLPPA